MSNWRVDLAADLLCTAVMPIASLGGLLLVLARWLPFLDHYEEAFIRWASMLIGFDFLLLFAILCLTLPSRKQVLH